MHRILIGLLVTASVLVACGAGWAFADPLLPGSDGPWSQAIYGNDGRLKAARGSEGRGVPLIVSSESSVEEGRLRTRVTYQKGSETLFIERIFDGSTGVDTVYEAGGERLVVSLVRDDLTGESLLVYRLPNGEVYTLWIAEDGEILTGDLLSLRRALRRPYLVTRLVSSYVRHKQPLDEALPSTGERMLMQQITCEDLCAEDCDRQCAFECAFGLPFCRLCKISCAIGCLIGCSG